MSEPKIDYDALAAAMARIAPTAGNNAPAVSHDGASGAYTPAHAVVADDGTVTITCTPDATTGKFKPAFKNARGKLVPAKITRVYDRITVQTGGMTLDGSITLYERLS